MIDLASLASYRVLIVGSSHQAGPTDALSAGAHQQVHEELDRLMSALSPEQTLTVVHRGSGGPESSADDWVRRLRLQGARVTTEIHLAGTAEEALGRMIAAGADLCLSFTREASGLVERLMTDAGIPLRNVVGDAATPASS
ncbi:hypothetical protein M1P56_34895 (plasmid) [Streptomyces sp. HU2014]|uniref:hypothetical protein n=1 Tax=Streptomyces sp. HU2014 TaxID=2939414 RepID=UPI00200FE558|nr:hypothetical protein [Streptomyces sp. HU2014]UQI49707.1 hypothetical protein M1P56_34895 [Streptomyces sp. HU2014]